jgi:hypothetical protein
MKSIFLLAPSKSHFYDGSSLDYGQPTGHKPLL